MEVSVGPQTLYIEIFEKFLSQKLICFGGKKSPPAIILLSFVPEIFFMKFCEVNCEKNAGTEKIEVTLNFEICYNVSSALEVLSSIANGIL
jgi:hypothetical protein